MKAHKTEREMRREQLAAHGQLWDGVTNPHGYDVTGDRAKYYTLGKRCNACGGPCYNATRVLVCQGCRAARVR